MNESESVLMAVCLAGPRTTRSKWKRLPSPRSTCIVPEQFPFTAYVPVNVPRKLPPLAVVVESVNVPKTTIPFPSYVIKPVWANGTNPAGLMGSYFRVRIGSLQ